MKEIKLSQGKVALVDDEDFEWLNQWRWFAHAKPGETYYAGRSVSPKEVSPVTQLWMHRVIMNTPKDMEVDHIDHNGLNNQKYNLRNCTHEQNNKNKIANNSIGYLGVSFYNPNRKKTKPFRATIFVDGRNIHLGTFYTAEDAAVAYNNAAIKYKGEFANLNIITDTLITAKELIDIYNKTH